MEAVNLYDYEAAARERLPRMVYDYYASGSYDEITLHENHAAYDRIALAYRVLRDVGRRDRTTTVLGCPVAQPILIAPTAYQSMADPEGEVATARAAAAAETVMMLSTLSNRAVEDVVAAAPGRVWFQLYVYKDRGATAELVARAAAAGCSAIVLTVDAQVWGRRERDVRNRFHLPPGLTMANLRAGQTELPTDVPDSGLAAYVASMFDPRLTWQDVDWLCGLSRLPVVVKGIVHPADARLAVEHGAAAVQVSNHGGRQLDTAPATIEVLEEIVAVVDGQAEVLVDGGIRRGTDVLKALAFGARAVAIGRPVLWGLAAAGEAGVRHVLELLGNELDVAMALCGCADLGQIDRGLIRRAGG